jgi:glycosyltransferase involved in cell wall biosynthesis
MKVLALIPDYLEKPSGGMGEQFKNLHSCLKNKVDYYICGYPEKNNIKNYKSAIAPIPNFPHISLTTIYGQSIYFLEALEFKQNFDIIHAFDYSTFYAGILCSWYFKKPLICTMQLSIQELNNNNIFNCHEINRIDGWHINNLQLNFEYMGLFYANKIIYVSQFYKEKFPDFEDKSIVILNGINLKEWKQNKKIELPGKNKLKFCYIGRASIMKGLNIILNSNIPEDIDFYFIVSEKNAEELIFANIKNKCNNKNIFHIPGLYGEDKINFLFEMDGVVMPSIHEPFGIVALEALASKCLFVSTGNGGIQEAIGDVPFFKISNTQDLESTFDKIKKLEAEEKNKIIAKGLKHVENYDWNIQSEKLYKIYLEVVNQKYNPNIIKID